MNLFIPSELNWDGTIVRQETRFPESNKTTLTILSPLTSHLSPLTLKLRYPYWASSMKVNGKRMKPGKDGYVNIFLTSYHSPLTSKFEIEFGMTLREESTKDDPSRVALLYGPVVLAGQLEKVANPFSDPKKYNDYYTFDYGRHPDVTYHALSDFRQTSPLHFTGPDGIQVRPFFDLHHHRYVVYWKKR